MQERHSKYVGISLFPIQIFKKNALVIWIQDNFFHFFFQTFIVCICKMELYRVWVEADSERDPPSIVHCQNASNSWGWAGWNTPTKSFITSPIRAHGSWAAPPCLLRHTKEINQKCRIWTGIIRNASKASSGVICSATVLVPENFF